MFQLLLSTYHDLILRVGKTLTSKSPTSTLPPIPFWILYRWHDMQMGGGGGYRMIFVRYTLPFCRPNKWSCILQSVRHWYVLCKVPPQVQGEICGPSLRNFRYQYFHSILYIGYWHKYNKLYIHTLDARTRKGWFTWNSGVAQIDSSFPTSFHHFDLVIIWLIFKLLGTSNRYNCNKMTALAKR